MCEDAYLLLAIAAIAALLLLTVAAVATLVMMMTWVWRKRGGVISK